MPQQRQQQRKNYMCNKTLGPKTTPTRSTKMSGRFKTLCSAAVAGVCFSVFYFLSSHESGFAFCSDQACLVGARRVSRATTRFEMRGVRAPTARLHIRMYALVGLLMLGGAMRFINTFDQPRCYPTGQKNGGRSPIATVERLFHLR